MSDNINLFELAARHKYRFPSVAGDLTLEQLYDLPLVKIGGCDLDTVARTLNTELKSISEESFVRPAPTSRETTLRNKLDLVKLVIAFKQDAVAAAEKMAANRARREKIREALAAREQQDLNTASRDDLLRELESLSEPT